MQRNSSGGSKNISRYLYLPTEGKSVFEEILDAENVQSNACVQNLRENLNNYKSQTEKFEIEKQNVLRRLSVSSQTSASEINKSIEMTPTHPQWQGNDFTIVSRKKKRSPDPEERRVRQKENSDTVVPTTNRFEILQSLHQQHPENSAAATRSEKKDQVQPIFVSNVLDFSKFETDMTSMGFENKYVSKVLNNQIKIIPVDVPTYRDIIKNFKLSNVSYFTHRLKEERPFRVVLRNVHHSATKEDITHDLADLGYVVENVANIKHAKTKVPLPMFFVDLKPNENNKSIYQVTKMGNKIVKFEPPNKKREVPQCKKCQRFGHTQNNCGRAFRCVKCLENHPTSECKKTRDVPAFCVNCGEDHPANYRGCEVYKKLLQKRFPTLRKKQPAEYSSRAPTPNFVKDNFSYAQAVRNEQPKINSDAATDNEQNSNDNFIKFMKQSFIELKDMFRDVMKQNAVMVNLLTALVSKIK